jgi:hypothetical protein
MGRNAADRLRDGGIAAKKADAILAPIDDIWIPPKGHPLWHPRQDDPVDEALVTSIMGGWRKGSCVLVRDDNVQSNGKRRLTLVDACRRTVNGREAQRRLRAAGILVATKDNPGANLYVEIEWFKGSDAELLLERLRRNREDPLKLADRPSVLAATAMQLAALHASSEAIADVMPKGVGRREVEALLDWPNLLAEVAARFDAGEAPLVFLRAVLDVPRDEQGAALEKLLASGAKSASGATKVLRREERAANHKPMVRVRPKRFFGALAERLKTVEPERMPLVPLDVVVRFLAGDDAALVGYESIKEVAAAAGWKPAKEGAR